MTTVADRDWFNDPALKTVLVLLNSNGGEARIAGGAVRNSLMGLPVADIDIATTLTPDVVMTRAEAAGIKAVPTGIAHGTVTLVVDGKPFEVTTLRRDVATDGRRAEVAFGADWQTDAERRDLTINALYARQDGTVVDLVGGLADIESRTIRFIGDAAARIAEDHLRILRFFRFFAYYGSGRPDADGLRACARAKETLAKLSAERVWAETKKLLAAHDPGRALLWMRQVGVLPAILPESEKWGIDSIPALVSAEQAFGWKPDPLLRLAAIVPPDGERLTAMAARLRLSRAEAAFFEEWTAAPAVSPTMAEIAFDRLLYRQGPSGVVTRLKLALATERAKTELDADALGRMAALQRLLARAETWQRPVFPIAGADVLAAGATAGPAVGKLLAQLEKDWLDANFGEDRAKLLARLKTLVDQQP
jgi:poly(A) polymerase